MAKSGRPPLCDGAVFLYLYCETAMRPAESKPMGKSAEPPGFNLIAIVKGNLDVLLEEHWI